MTGGKADGHRAQDLGILVLLGAVFIPFTLWMPFWVSGGFLVLIGVRTALAWSGRPLPPRHWRVFLALAVLAAVVASWGAPFGLREGTALFLLMIAVKSFEQTTDRDRQVTVLLCCFLLPTGTLFSHSLPLFLYQILLLAGILTVLQRLQGSPASRNKALGRSARLLLQALPLAMVMFLLFPRLGGGLISLSPSSQTSYTGLSDTLSPGDVSRLIPSGEVAFRVKFHKLPRTHDRLYWRSLVLTRFDGSTWRRAKIPSASTEQVEAHEGIAEYSVDLSPTGRKYLPALGIPLEAPEGADIRGGFLLRRKEKVTSRLRYSLRSALRYRTGPVRPEVRAAALEIQPRSNPRTRDLVRQLQQGTSGPRELTAAVLERFDEENYIYTRTPAPLREQNPVDQFLFRTKEGFCGHYAQALAWIARAAGIPARIVTGYLGGSRNPLGNYWIVRQSDAHAWVEIYFPESGWERRDPTRSLSPDQIAEKGESGIRDENGTPGPSWPEGEWPDRVARYAGLAWDAARFGWNYYVLGFTQERQLELLAGLRLGDSIERALPRAALLLTFLFLAFMLILLAILVSKKGKSRPWDRIYRRFRKKLRWAGIDPRIGEGPLSLARRIEEEKPDLAPACRRILHLFVELRYSGRGDRKSLRDLRRYVRRFPIAPRHSGAPEPGSSSAAPEVRGSRNGENAL